MVQVHNISLLSLHLMASGEFDQEHLLRAAAVEEPSSGGIIRSMNPDVKARFEEEELPTANQVA